MKSQISKQFGQALSPQHKALFVAISLTPIWLALLFFRFFLEEKGMNVFWNDNFDSRLILWIFERNYLSLTNLPLSEFWNANQFYPTQGSLAFSDSIIAGQIIYLPMRLAGFSPLESLYITFFVIIFISTYLIVLIGNSIISLRIFEWLIFCFICQLSLTTTNFLNHYQLFAFQLAPAFFLLVYSTLINFTGRKLVGLTVLFIAISSFATYFAPMSVAIGLIIIVSTAFRDRQMVIISAKKLMANPKALLISTILLGVFFYIQLLPYVEILKDLPRQNMAETKVYSAKLLSLFNAPSPASEIYKASVINGYWEYSYFPGFVILFGAILGILCTLNQNQGRYEFISYFMLVMSCAALILSFGPYFEASLFGSSITVPLPFYLITKIVPGFENIRAPGRFGSFLSLPLAYFFIVGLRSLHLKKYSNFLLVTALALLIYDSRITANIFPNKPVDNESFYNQARHIIEYRDPTLILPLHKPSHIETILGYINQLHISNETGAWVVAGYGAKSTDILGRYTSLSRELMNKKTSLNDVFCQAREDGIINIIIDLKPFLIERTGQNICGFKVALNVGNLVLYRIDDKAKDPLN